MTREEAIRWFDYDAWANARLLAALEAAPADVPDARVMLAHVLVAQRLWRGRLRGDSPVGVNVFPDTPLADLPAEAAAASASWREFLASPEADLERRYSYKTIAGDAYESTLADIVRHVTNHGTHHRGQAARAMRQAGVAPPALDFIVFSREG